MPRPENFPFPDQLWKPIRVAPRYYVSNAGYIFDTEKLELKKRTIARNGFAVVNLRAGGGWRVTAVHTVVAEAFLGVRPAGMMVTHRDGDKTNCRVSNLSYTSLAARTPPSGNDDPSTRGRKLNPGQATSIRERARAGASTLELAIEYGVSSAMISNIKYGQRWKKAPAD